MQSGVNERLSWKKEYRDMETATFYIETNTEHPFCSGLGVMYWS